MCTTHSCRVHGIELLDPSSVRGFYCTECGIKRVHLLFYCSTLLFYCSTVQLYSTECGIKRVHLTIGGCCAACSHGNSEQVQDTQLFQSLIMPILFSQLIIIILVISTTILSFNIYNISSAQVVMKVILTILTKFSSPLNVGFSREHQTGVSLQTSR